VLSCLCRIFTVSGYKSSVDYPGTTFFQEIFKQNPDAKVILSQRDSAEVLAHVFLCLAKNVLYPVPYLAKNALHLVLRMSPLPGAICHDPCSRFHLPFVSCALNAGASCECANALCLRGMFLG
jgi:hypothetical protein